MKIKDKFIVYGTVISYSLLVFLIGFILLEMIDVIFPMNDIVFGQFLLYFLYSHF